MIAEVDHISVFLQFPVSKSICPRQMVGLQELHFYYDPP